MKAAVSRQCSSPVDEYMKAAVSKTMLKSFLHEYMKAAVSKTMLKSGG